MTVFKEKLLLLTIAAFQLLSVSAWALPTVIAGGHLTDRFGPHSLPGMPVGDKVQVFAALNSTDPIGSPSVSVEVAQGGTTLTLDPIGPLYPIFAGYHLYYKFIDFDPSLTGSWQIIPTDSTGIGPSALTNPIAEPEFLPLAENIAVQGTSLNARVSWTLPNLAGFDVDGVFVRVIEATSGRHMWSSDLLSLQTTSVLPPSGVLQVGTDYVYWINLVDLVDIQGPYVENSSKAFSEPFRLTLTGDYNQNGIVDAADYSVWRDNLGGTALVNRGPGISGSIGQADYLAWKNNFGASFGAGSGAALPSAAPLSPAVPEPAALALIALASLGLSAHRPRIATRNRLSIR